MPASSHYPAKFFTLLGRILVSRPFFLSFASIFTTSSSRLRLLDPVIFWIAFWIAFWPAYSLGPAVHIINPSPTSSAFTHRQCSLPHCLTTAAFPFILRFTLRDSHSSASRIVSTVETAACTVPCRQNCRLPSQAPQLSHTQVQLPRLPHQSSHHPQSHAQL